MDIYNATIDMNEWETGIYRISLVKYPATETSWQTFSKEKKPLKFNVENDEKHLVKGVLMLADTPIYRRDGDYEYYIVFSKETLRQMAQKMLRFNYQNNLNTEHNEYSWADGMFMQEIFVKDSERGISPAGFDDVPEGSLFATYYVDSNDLWKQIKDNTFSGFSIEAYMNVELIEPDDPEEAEVLSLLEQLKNKLSKN